MGLFRKKVRADLTSVTGPVFHIAGYESVHQRQPLPDPGAGNYSWETLQLKQQTPIGPSVAARGQVKITGQQIYVRQGVTFAGLGTVQGQLINQPLSNDTVQHNAVPFSQPGS